ncbi:MAG TPA: DUF6350 family protein [Mycobacteriales bacterium]|nr:DUF6350 family protein [Mycobacteriales bacterium]
MTQTTAASNRAAAARLGAVRSQAQTARRRRDQPHAAAVAPLWLRSLLAAAWSTAVGLAVLVVLSLVDWTADSRTTSSAGAAIRFAVALWLDAQRAPLHVPGGEIAVAPLGLSLLLGGLLARFARILLRDAPSQQPGAVAAMVFAVSIPYAGIAAALAVAARTSSIRPSPVTAFVAAGGFAVLATTIGGMRGAGQWAAAWDRLSEASQAALRAAASTAALLLAAATLLTIGALLDHHTLIGNSLSGYGNGSGQFSMALLSIWLIPNAVLMAAAYLTGTGFVVGSGTSVTLGHAHLGAIPALPILAGLPHGGAPTPLFAVAVAVVVGAGAIAAWRVHRDADHAMGDQVAAALAAGVLTGLGAALLVAVAGGPAGPGRLSVFGASPWKVGLSVALEIGIPAALFVAANSWWDARRSSPETE